MQFDSCVSPRICWIRLCTTARRNTGTLFSHTSVRTAWQPTICRPKLRFRKTKTKNRKNPWNNRVYYFTHFVVLPSSYELKYSPDRSVRIFALYEMTTTIDLLLAMSFCVTILNCSFFASYTRSLTGTFLWLFTSVTVTLVTFSSLRFNVMTLVFDVALILIVVTPLNVELIPLKLGTNRRW